MPEESIVQLQLEHHDSEIHTLTQDLNELKINVTILTQKQVALIEKLDTFITKMSVVDDRITKLENFMLAHLEKTALIKGIIKFWPAILATLFFCFSIGIMVDDQKVANEIANKVELKAP